MSQAKLARELGLSGAMVSKLKARGMPIDSIEAAQAWRKSNLDPSLKKEVRRPDPDDVEDDLVVNESSSYTKARTVTERFRAKSAELAYRKAVGEVIEKVRLEAALANILVVARRALQKMPDVLAARLAAEPDSRKARAMLSDAIEQTLTDMSDAITALPEQLTATQQ